MASQEILDRLNKAREPKPKKVYKGPAKKSAKMIAKEKAEKEIRGGEPTDLQKWFWRCIGLMSGNCYETGLPTRSAPYAIAICSICHILPQQSCKSVALHEFNWIELDKDFHKKFDAMSWEEREQMKCWPEIRDRLILIYDDLATSERRHFPDSVLLWMQENPEKAEAIVLAQKGLT